MDRYCPKCLQEFSSDHDRCPNDGSVLVAAVEENLVGQTLDERYKILSKLGQGGMGVVYVAEQPLIGRKVALKVLKADASTDKAAVRRFLNEAKAIASLKSAHTVTLHDFGVTSKGLLYYTMELLEGRPLSRLIREEGPLGHERAADFMFQILDSLEEAHEHGILHRDIKPDNIFVSLVRGKEQVKVLDFGIAKLLGDTSIDKVTRTGMICGTPQYLSPEQALGNPVVPASDLYSLGIVLYEMLAGSPPFIETTPMKILLQHLNDRPEPVSIRNPKVEVPRSMEALLHKALRKKPEDRYRTVAEFKEALEEALQSHEQRPGTTSLPGMETTADGVRLLGGDAKTPRDAERWFSPGDAEPRATADYEAGADPPSAGETMAQSIAEDGGNSPHTTADVQSTWGRWNTVHRPSSRLLWVAVGVLCLIAIAILAVWRPWVDGTDGTDRTDRTYGTDRTDRTDRTVEAAEASGLSPKAVATPTPSPSPALGPETQAVATPTPSPAPGPETQAVATPTPSPAPGPETQAVATPTPSPAPGPETQAVATPTPSPAPGPQERIVESTPFDKSEGARGKSEPQDKSKVVSRKSEPRKRTEKTDDVRMGFKPVEIPAKEEAAQPEPSPPRMGIQPVEITE